MTLSNKNIYLYVLGGLIAKPSLLTEYDDIEVDDFDLKIAKIIFSAIRDLTRQGYSDIDPLMIETEIEKHMAIAQYYKQNNGTDYINDCIEFGASELMLQQFKENYNILKKNALLRALKAMHYDISYFYKDDSEIKTVKEENELIEHFNDATPEIILDKIEGNLNEIRSRYLQGGRSKKDAANGIKDLIEEFKTTPNAGPNLCGKLFNIASRGARTGCFYLKSAKGNAGKTRTSVFDACQLAYPERFSRKDNCFIKEIDNYTKEIREPIKTLFIVTEMDETEIQTIILAFLSKVNETHILTGQYLPGEEERIDYAIQIMEKYKGYLMIETISDPNFSNVTATIKKYAMLDGVKAVFFDYLHSTASLLTQFASAKIREDVALMILSNQLKQLAKDYHLFMSSSTQVNSDAMDDNDGSFKNEMVIRGSKAIADKADLGFIMSRVNPQIASELRKKLGSAKVNPNFNRAPNFVIDIYRNRRGQFKNVRIWIDLDLGTGEREDLFITNADNTPIAEEIVSYSTVTEYLDFSWDTKALE